jgi:hypothetical protein
MSVWGGLHTEPAAQRTRYLSMVLNGATRLVAIVALLAGECLAQTSPAPGPTMPRKSLPVPKGGENIVINPTTDECKAGWRPELKWTKDEFDNFCRQLKISK